MGTRHEALTVMGTRQPEMSLATQPRTSASEPQAGPMANLLDVTLNPLILKNILRYTRGDNMRLACKDLARDILDQRTTIRINNQVTADLPRRLGDS